MKGFHDKRKGIGISYDDICLVNGARTPFGKLCGTLAQVSPTDLGIYASRAAIERSELKGEDIDQLMYANIGQSSADSYFLPRHIGLYAGIPEGIPALMLLFFVSMEMMQEGGRHGVLLRMYYPQL